MTRTMGNEGFQGGRLWDECSPLLGAVCTTHRDAVLNQRSPLVGPPLADVSEGLSPDEAAWILIYPHLCPLYVYSASLNRRQPHGISEMQRASSTPLPRPLWVTQPCFAPRSLGGHGFEVSLGSQRPCVSQYNSPHF